MILIIGGAYQGKLEYTKENYSINDRDVFTCDEGCITPDLSQKVIYGLHKLILEQIRSNMDTGDFLKTNLNHFSDKIIICDDISCGIVPMDAQMRSYREAVGRALAYLSNNANEVIRVFCGLGTRLK
jgi:adenosyl cobinamide kinase/adenosyl cobinamide phosphate guanylyltransferase